MKREMAILLVGIGAGLVVDRGLMCWQAVQARRKSEDLFVLTSLNCQNKPEVVVQRLTEAFGMSSEEAQLTFNRVLASLVRHKGVLRLGDAYRLTAEGHDMWNALRIGGHRRVS